MSDKLTPSPKLPLEKSGEICRTLTPEQIQTTTHARLCDLRSQVDASHSPKATLSNMQAVQKELGKIAPTEIHPGEVVLYIQSPSRQVYRVQMQQGKGSPKGVPFVFVFPDGKRATITRQDENGYNSEYDVSFGDQKGLLLGLIFTAENPEIKVRRGMIERAQKRLNSSTQEIKRYQGEIKTLENLIYPSKTPKKSKKKPDTKKIQEGNDRITTLRDTQIPELRKNILTQNTSIQKLTKEIDTFQKYIAFPYSPYQPTLDVPTIYREGIGYIGSKVKEAYQKIAIADPIMGMDFAIHTPASVVLLLNVIERMDYHQYIDTEKPQRIVVTPERRSGKKIIQKEISHPAVILKDQAIRDSIMESQMNRALTVFALNTEGAYNFQVSDVGAAGIAQLMPDTYTGLKKKYPGLLGHTPERPLDGSRVHTTALEYQAVHVYDQYTQLPGWIRSNWDAIMADPDTRLGIYMILACGYNGMMKGVMKEIGMSSDEPDNWKDILAPKTILSKFQILKHKYAEERYTYALKFQYLYKKLGQDTVIPPR